VFTVVSGAVLLAGEARLSQSAFDRDATAEWQPWAVRDEIAPRTDVSTERDRGQPGALMISGGGNASAYGGWQRVVDGIEPGTWYRFIAHYQATGLDDEALRVVSRLDWARQNGKRAGQPDYVFNVESDGDWRRVTLDAPAPPEASSVKLQLILSYSADGKVWWDDVSLTPIPAPQPRLVRVATVKLTPRNTGSREASVQRFLDVIDHRVSEDADVILLSEGITVVGTGKSYADVAETIPGPTSRALGEMARKKKSYIAAGIYERDGIDIFNTAILVDRKGEVVGKYRKVYLPREEIEGGITPGNDYPVFQTDFGKVGMMICWDIQYADPARGLALNGAELILTPIWGGNEALGKARAIENQVFIATAGYNYPSLIMDRDGDILAHAKDDGTVAMSTIDLNKRYADEWLGDMRGRFMKELRLDVPVRASK
jgi:predicted amidohydrolase